MVYPFAFKWGGMKEHWLNKINWSEDGLVPAIAQDANTGRVLMLAWMNRDALKRTVESGEAVYWSRSRKKLWHKGEESGHIQQVKEVRLDCDSDVVLLLVAQGGGSACHTGRVSCFFSRLDNKMWVETDAVIKNPDEMYRKK